MASNVYFGILSTLFHLVLSSVRFNGNPQQFFLNGRQFEQGNVEILDRGSWKRLAATFFDDNDANVICKMMGYTTGGQHVHQNQVSRRNAGMYAILGSLACSGHEESVEYCTHYSHSKNPWLQSLGFFPVAVRCFAVWTCAANHCPSQSSCYMTHGRPICKCLSGFTYNVNRNVCEDDDECTQKYQCSRNAHCYNTPGSFVCRCKSGFGGNGQVCSNKCNSYRCPSRSVCTIWNGEPRCQCNSGYVRNGNFCISSNQENSNDSPGKRKGKRVDVEHTHMIIGVVLGAVIAIILLTLIFYKVRQRSLHHTASANRTNSRPDEHATTGATNIFVITGPTEFSNSSPSNNHGFDTLPNYFTLYPEGIANRGASHLGEAPSYEAVIGEGNQYDTLTTVNLGDSEDQNEAGTNSNHYDNVAYENHGPPPAYEEISAVH